MDNDGKGEVFYGIHFYPGVAEYKEDTGDKSLVVFLNETTIRNMDQTFAACPVYLEHVDDVPDNLDQLKKEADGWVVKSFYNPVDGKHWAEFVVVTTRALNAIKSRHMRLSNCYKDIQKGPGGIWNGVKYDYEILSANYEHLAIVPNPRYDESIILTRKEFDKYNEEKKEELKKLSNSLTKREKTMKMPKFDLFRRTKVEEPIDLEGMTVFLQNKKIEVSIEKLINEADEPEASKMAHPDHMVDMKNGERLSVKRLTECYNDSMEQIKKMKDAEESAEKEEKEDERVQDSEEDEGGYAEHEKEEKEDKEKNKKNKKNEEEIDKQEEGESLKKKNAKEKAMRLKNAPYAYMNSIDLSKVDTTEAKIERAKALFAHIK